MGNFSPVTSTAMRFRTWLSTFVVNTVPGGDASLFCMYSFTY